MPSPPGDRTNARGDCAKISKTRGNISAVMPMPLSLTETITSLPCRSALSRMRPPSSVYLAALLSRLASTWASRTGSASRWIGSGGKVTVSS